MADTSTRPGASARPRCRRWRGRGRCRYTGRAQLNRVRAAADVAQASEFVARMDGGYSAAIAQGGSNVSGGQKQRLSIARAVYRHPEILIFDDSFSALDFKTDREVRDALAREAKDSTKLIVAQRIGTIMNADRHRRARRRQGRGSGHAQGTARQLRRIPPDRRIPAQPVGAYGVGGRQR